MIAQTRAVDSSSSSSLWQLRRWLGRSTPRSDACGRLLLNSYARAGAGAWRALVERAKVRRDG